MVPSAPPQFSLLISHHLQNSCQSYFYNTQKFCMKAFVGKPQTAQWVQTPEKIFWWTSPKIDSTQPCDPALYILEKCLPSLSGNMYTNIFRTTDHNSKTLKLPECLLQEEWMKNCGKSDSVIFSSSQNKNATAACSDTDFSSTMLKEQSKSPNNP